MHAHGSKVGGDENSIIVSCDPQNSWIESAVRNYVRSWSEVYRRLPSEQALPDIGINVGIGLKADFQASPCGASFLARSKRSIMS
jgi:hypothetical protein